MNNSQETQDFEPITCHKVSPVFNIPEIKWRGDRKPVECSYCGSLYFDEVKRIVEEGGKLGGSDYKYGWPHKFYVYTKDGNMHKFYNEHLLDLPVEECGEFFALLKEHAGIEFFYQDGNLMYRAPYYGYQR